MPMPRLRPSVILLRVNSRKIDECGVQAFCLAMLSPGVIFEMYLPRLAHAHFVWAEIS